MDITQLKGVGAVTANNLNRLSVYTVEDLVKLYPRDYDVYEEPVFISSIDDDTEIAAIEGTVVEALIYMVMEGLKCCLLSLRIQKAVR